MIIITADCIIPDEEITFEFMRSSGPGGQNVNKVETAVRLRFDLESTRSLSEETKTRLYNIAGKRITKNGQLTIVSRKSRRQEKNRQEALEKFKALVLQASKPPKPYKKTTVPFYSKVSRLETKKRRSLQKRLRRFPESAEN
jgi:ribosome-associated protein